MQKHICRRKIEWSITDKLIQKSKGKIQKAEFPIFEFFLLTFYYALVPLLQLIQRGSHILWHCGFQCMCVAFFIFYDQLLRVQRQTI